MRVFAAFPTLVIFQIALGEVKFLYAMDTKNKDSGDDDDDGNDAFEPAD